MGATLPTDQPLKLRGSDIGLPVQELGELARKTVAASVGAATGRLFGPHAAMRELCYS